jgi:hypothetical protein
MIWSICRGMIACGMGTRKRKECTMFSPSMPAIPPLSTLTRNWWAILLRGVLAVLFGVLALTFARVTLVALVLVFGVYALLDGASLCRRGGRTCR